MPSAVAALNIGVGPCWGVTCGDMLKAMARITPSQPNDAMARIAFRRNRTISLDPNLPTVDIFGGGDGCHSPNDHLTIILSGKCMFTTFSFNNGATVVQHLP
jgi:hypothetical protein